MGMTTRIHGFVEPNEDYQKKAEAYRACMAAGIAPPILIEEFFNYEEPSPSGMKVDIKDAVTKRDVDMQDFYEVDISKLPKGVTKIAFVNSY
jgi:hypothetical protein